MRKLQIFSSVLVFLFVCVDAKAGDREDVLARVADFYAALNAGDVDAMPFVSHTRYNVEGGLIETPDPNQVKAWMKGAFAAGLTVNVQTFHENVDVYGDAAVFTCYERVNVNPPQGDPINDSRRVTIVLIKQKGEWNHVHVHLSYLNPANPE